MWELNNNLGARPNKNHQEELKAKKKSSKKLPTKDQLAPKHIDKKTAEGYIDMPIIAEEGADASNILPKMASHVR